MSRRITNHFEMVERKSGQWLKKVTERYFFEEKYCCKWVRLGYKHSAKKSQKKTIRQINKNYIKRGEWE